MPFVHAAALLTGTDAPTFTSPAFTPGAGDLLIAIFTIPRYCFGTGSVSDSAGGSWTKRVELSCNADGSDRRDHVVVCTRNSAVAASSMTVTVAARSSTPYSGTAEANADGCSLAVLRVRNPSASAFTAPRQGIVGSIFGPDTPTLTFGSACLATNVVVAGIAGAGTPALAPPTGFVERMDASHSSPTCGMEYVTHAPGFTGTTFTWGSATAIVYGKWALEIPHTGIVPPAPPRTFLAVNGLALDVEYGTWKEGRAQIGELDDQALSGQSAESRAGLVRRWSCRLTPHGARTVAGPMVADAANIAKLQQWIEGRGQRWDFNSAAHSYSAAGFCNTAIGAFTRSTSSGKHGGRLTVSLGSVFGVNMTRKLGVRGGWTPASGWSLLCWRNFQSGESASAGWHTCILTGAVDFARGSASNPTGVTQYLDGVAGSYSLGRCFSVSATTPFVGLHGYLTTNSAAAAEYDDFMFLPFELPASWIGAVGDGVDLSMLDFAEAYPLPPLPHVYLTGAAVDPADTYAVVRAIGRVRGAVAEQLVDGGVKATLPALDVEFTEWVE